MTDLGADVIVHAVAAGVVIVVAFIVAGYIRHSRAALVQLVDIFRATVEASRIVSEADHADLSRLIRNVEKGVAGVMRLEAAGVIIADDLATAHRNADAVGLSEPPGSAADAASRQTVAESER